MSHASHQQSAESATATNRSPKIVAALSLKGGVGKTSVVLGVAGAAAAAGLKVLVVDLDPQANATATLQPSETPFTTSDVLYDSRPGIAAGAIVPSSWQGKLDLIPSEPALEHRSQSPGPGSELRLRTALAGVADQYDLVLFDCPPSLGELTRNALYAASAALVVTEPTFFAVQGAAQAIDAVAVVAANGNAALTPAGIVVNRMRTTLDEHRLRMTELQQEFGDLVLGGLPDRSAVPQAQGARIPVQDWDSNGAADISKALGLLLNKLMDAEVASPKPGAAKSAAPKPAKVSQAQAAEAGQTEPTSEPAKTVDLTSGKQPTEKVPASRSTPKAAAKPSLANITPTYHFTTSE